MDVNTSKADNDFYFNNSASIFVKMFDVDNYPVVKVSVHNGISLSDSFAVHLPELTVIFTNCKRTLCSKSGM